MEEKKNNKGFIWLIVILIVLLLGLVGYIVYDKVLKVEKTNKENSTTILISTTNKNIKNKVIERKGEITFNDLVELLKDYYINQEVKEGISDFYDEDNVEKWNIDNIKYLGYYEDEENIKYYVANGNFKCKDNEYTCVYMEQADYETTDNIPFKAIFAIKQTDNKYTLDHIESQSFDEFVKGNSIASQGFILKNELLIMEKEWEEEKISLSNYPEKNDDIVNVYGDIYVLAKKYLDNEKFTLISDDKENFKDITFSINNNKFSLSCEEFNTDNEYNMCMEKSVIIDNKIKLNFDNFVEYLGTYIMITDKYYIVQFGNSVSSYGNVIIYDNNGNKLLETEPTTFYDGESLKTKYVTIFENKLFFIKHINCMNTLSYIDLNKSDLNIVELDSKSTEGANEC